MIRSTHIFRQRKPDHVIDRRRFIVTPVQRNSSLSWAVPATAGLERALIGPIVGRVLTRYVLGASRLL
jgi:hypothetical protein